MKGRVQPRAAAGYTVFFAGVLSVTTAALFWLAVSSGLTAVGVRMDRLRERRAQLLQERSDAMVLYAQATDPKALEVRASALGLGPADTFGRLSVAGVPPATSGSGGVLGRMVTARRSSALDAADNARGGTRPELTSSAAIVSPGGP